MKIIQKKAQKIRARAALRALKKLVCFKSQVYRDRQGHSVDLVLETDGKVFAVQMSPYSPGAAGLKSLAYFREKTAGCSEGTVISIYPPEF